MSRKRTHEEFVELMADKNPSLKVASKYIGNSEYVIVVDCDGIEYKSLPTNLLKGKKPKLLSACDTQKAFEIRASKMHLDFKVVSKYINKDEYIVVECPLGIQHKVLPSNFLKGKRPTISSAIDQELAFSTMMKESLQGYELSSKYSNGEKHITIKDSDGFEFRTLPNTVLKGQSPKIFMATNPTEVFVHRAKKATDNFYSYSETEYESGRGKVVVTCPIHGNFDIRAQKHLHGQGCGKCAKEGRGWTPRKWGASGIKSKSFEKFRVYILEVHDNVTEESFIKIGKSYTSMNHRFGDFSHMNKKRMPYTYNVLKFIGDGEGIEDAIEISKLEVNLHRKYREGFKYKPKKKFKGDTECFNMSIKDDLLALDFDEMLSNL